MISVRITGKNVSDDFAGPSMVYSHAQPSIIENSDHRLEQTRVVHPAGQRASNGLRGTKINANETRPLSAGRGAAGQSGPTARAPVPVRTAVAARKKNARAESPTRPREHDSTLLSRYENGTIGRTQEKAATERTINERHNIDNELKRHANSAMRHKAEKAEVTT